MLYCLSGDPAVFGNLAPHPAVNEALKAAVDSNRFNGMAHTMGVLEVRESVARQLSRYPTKHPLTADVSPPCIRIIDIYILYSSGYLHDLWDPRSSGDKFPSLM